MFENLRRAFREAVDNFKEELGSDDASEAVDRMLSQMKREAEQTNAETRRLEAAIRKANEAANTEKRDAQTCRRRERMALKIGDEETVRVAREYVAKHEYRHSVLKQKAHALGEELNMRRAEFEEMIESIKAAESSRATLAATARRATARKSVHQAEDLFAEVDRIARDIEEGDARTEAQREANELLSDDGLRADPLGDSRSSAASTSMDIDAELEALKRAMGRSK